jgi:hypothetical protein
MTHADDEKLINILARKPKREIRRGKKPRFKIYGMWVWI